MTQICQVVRYSSGTHLDSLETAGKIKLQMIYYMSDCSDNGVDL